MLGRPRGRSPCSAIASALGIVLALASVGAARADDVGFLLGDEYRWEHRNVLERAAMDVVAIPAHVVRWEPRDWATFGGWAAAVGILTFAGRPVLDVHIDRWITLNLDDRVPVIWTDPMQAVLWGSIAVGGLGAWGWAWLKGNREVWQGLSLMAEALAVSQVYHLTFKILLGREGPEDGLGHARIFGPAHAFRLFPAGTPSGHAATLFSLMSAGFAYFQPPWWAQAIGYTLVGGVVAFHVINHRHFISDSLWGSAMGWYVGQWVVNHRASWRFGERSDSPRLTVLPFGDQRSAGLALSGAF